MRSNMTGLGFNNSDYRSFNRSFGRGNSKPYRKPQRQPSPQPTRKGDLFIEAGRLAVEYLVSHGLLSSNVLSGKWQNGTLRNSSRELKDHRSAHDKEIPLSPVRGRSVGVGNQGGGTPDGVSCGRKSQYDDDSSVDRNSTRERRRPGLSRSYSSDRSQENEREGSLLDKVTASQRLEADNDNFRTDTNKDPDTDARISHSVESSSKENRDGKLLDEMKKGHADVDLDSKTTSMLQTKDDGELPKQSDEVDTGCEETKDGTGKLDDTEKETSMDELDIQQCEEKLDSSNKDGADLLKLCSSAKIPTKIRSSLVNKSPKRDRVFINKEESTSDTGCDSRETAKDAIINGSSEIPSSLEIPSSNCVTTTISEHSFVDVGVPNPSYGVNQQKPAESLSFADKTFSYEQKSSELPELGSYSPTGKDRGEKRALIEENIGEGAKRAKQWLSVAQSDDYSQFSDLSEKQSILPENRAVTANIFNGTNQENFTNVSLPLQGGVESTVDQGEEKQLFSSSFKICDLNLMEASDMHENRDIPPLLYPSISAPNKVAPVGIDLSMNNHNNLNDMYNGCGSARKGIEIIDLESDTQSLQDGKSMPTSMEVDIRNMGNFPNNSQNANDNPDGQDGYGLMISELLANDDPNCSSVQPDMNSLHNDMGLHHGEGMFGEDDPIYMSLGEIPISLLRVWEQPTQERNPFEL